MKTFKALLLVASLFVLPAFAETQFEQMMISINKLESDRCEAHLTEKVIELKLFLNSHLQSGEDHVSSTLISYVDYTAIAEDAPYYGVAVVELEYSSPAMRKAFVERISKDNRYQIYANGPITRRTVADPFP